MENVISRQEHEEFVRRIDAENERQNKRIGLLEDSIRQMNTLTISVEKMAINMENMLSAIERQGVLIEKQSDRLDSIEKAPAEDSKKFKMTIITTIATTAITTIVGAIIGAILVILQKGGI